jgi:ABC-type transport system involved in multi-copper enzyme maturation permease subunit
MTGMNWKLWARQTWAVARLELHKSLLQRRAWWLLAIAPVLLTGAHSILAARGTWGCSMGVDTRAFASIFQLFIVRFGIFFGCAGIFTTLFRGEMAEKTMHYYFLAPVRREVLAAGKYLAGEITALVFFTGGSALSYVLITLHFGAAHWERLFRGPGLYELGWYMIVSTLACLGYGAIFMGFGLWFKNPMIPAAALMVWEGINPFLPSVLKKVSVIFYLQGLCPTDVPMNGPLALLEIMTDPTPAWLAIPGLLLLTAIVLAMAGWTVRDMEVSYGD